VPGKGNKSDRAERFEALAPKKAWLSLLRAVPACKARDKDNEIKRLREVARPVLRHSALDYQMGRGVVTCKLAYHCHGTGSTSTANTAILAASCRRSYGSQSETKKIK
jgi:hypothetical protein